MVVARPPTRIGIVRLGRGRRLTFRAVNSASSRSTVAPRRSWSRSCRLSWKRRQRSRCSAASSSRGVGARALLGCGQKGVKSSSGEPSPMPSITRPRERWSSVITSRASCRGRLRATGVTLVPIVRLVVVCAVAPSTGHGSITLVGSGHVHKEVIPEEEPVPGGLPGELGERNDRCWVGERPEVRDGDGEAATGHDLPTRCRRFRSRSRVAGRSRRSVVCGRAWGGWRGGFGRR